MPSFLPEAPYHNRLHPIKIPLPQLWIAYNFTPQRLMRNLIKGFESTHSGASFGLAGFWIGENPRGILKKAVWGEECLYHS
jgi:hypothetical protein